MIQQKYAALEGGDAIDPTSCGPIAANALAKAWDEADSYPGIALPKPGNVE